MKALILTSIAIFALSLNFLYAQDLPLTLSSSDVFWYSISDLDGLNDNDKIQIWNDRSGANNDAIQNSAAYRPNYANDEDELINGVPTVYFNGHNRMFNIENTTDINTSGTFEEKSLMVFIKTSDNIEDMQMIYEEGGRTRGLNLYIYDSKLYAGVWNRANDGGLTSNYYDVISVSADIEVSKDYMISVLFDGSNDSFGLYLNGSLVELTNGVGTLYSHSGNIGIGGVAGYTRTHIGDINTAYFEGYLSEFVFFDIALTDEELDALEDFLGPTYGFDHTGLLPVEMISYETNIENGLTYINWSTASEINNDYFTIERSNDMMNWYSAGTVYGAGNANERNDYEFVDFEAVNGTVYYRISQTDFDGTTEVFDVMSVHNQISSEISVDVYPNPVVDNLVVTNNSFNNIKLVVVNNAGQIVKSIDTNSSITSIEMSNLPQGNYVLTIVSEDNSSVSKSIVKY